MNTLKSAALVVVLTGVLVGVYVTIYKPPAGPPPGMSQTEFDALGPPLIEEDPADVDGPKDYPLPDRGLSRTVPPLVGRGGATDPADAGVNDLEPNPADSSVSTGAQSASHNEPIPNAGLPQSIYGSETVDDARQPPASAAAAPEYDPIAVSRRLLVHNFKRDWELAQRQVQGEQFRAALATLTPYHAQADLPPEHQSEVTAWLDALAAKVIYSREHLLESAYYVRGTKERLINVAQRYGVTTQLLQNINAQVVNNPDVLLAGTELKVLRGPFRAEIDLARNEVTVFLGELYAGRFPFARGDEPVVPGQYQVHQKQILPTYVDNSGRTVAGNDPANPYGSFCLSLGSQVRIHGSPLVPTAGRPRGCISLSPRDIEDLFAILSEGSVVVIK